jgi:hypothetical protein
VGLGTSGEPKPVTIDPRAGLGWVSGHGENLVPDRSGEASCLSSCSFCASFPADTPRPIENLGVRCMGVRNQVDGVDAPVRA